MTAQRPRVALTLEQCWHEVPGGTARAALELVDALRSRDNVAMVGIAARHDSPPAEAYRPSIPVEHVALPRLAMYESWHWLRRPLVESTTGPVDLVHATGIAVPPTKVPLVSTLHDLAFLHLPEMYTRRGNSFFRRALELTRRHAAIVCCSSLATLEDCAEAGIDRSRLRHVPLGVDIAPVTDDDRQRVRRRYGLERPFVLWTGTREPRKNLARLLDAFARADTGDAELVLVGPSGWHSDQTGLDAPQPKNVRTLGFVPRDDLDALYSCAEIFCFPSLLEGFGLPVVEAMGHGTAVITSLATSTEEVAGDAGVLIDPLDVDALASAIESLLAEDERRARLGAAGWERAMGYTWDRCAELTEAVYAEALGR